MQWVEWDKNAMAAGSFLPATDATPFFLGDYDATKPFPNPSTLTGQSSWPNNPLTFTLENNGDPTIATPGDIGKVSYYPYDEGPF